MCLTKDPKRLKADSEGSDQPTHIQKCSLAPPQSETKSLGYRLTKNQISQYTDDYHYLELASRITVYLEVKICSLPKHENLTTCNKYCGKDFPQ